MAGDGEVKNHLGSFTACFLFQFCTVLIFRSRSLTRVAAKYMASSPNVQLCRTGIDHRPINEEQLSSSSIGPSAKLRSPPIRFGLSKINSGLFNSAQASMISVSYTHLTL